MLTGTPLVKIPLGRFSRTREANIGMDLKEICANTRNCIGSAQD